MSNAVWAFGTVLQIGDGGSPESFVSLAEGLSVTPFVPTADVIDLTNHDSPGGWEEALPTIFRTGEAVFEGNYIASHATHQQVRTDLQNRTKRNFKIILPDPGAETWSFSAYVVRFELNPHDPTVQQKMTCAVKITGQPTFTY